MVIDLNHVIEQIHKEKGIPKEALVDAVESAMLTAARKILGLTGNMEAQYNPDSGEVELFQFKTVAETVEDPHTQMALENALKLDPDAVVGDELGEKMDSRLLGRIAAQAAKQVIIQKLRDAERDIVVTEYQDKLGEVLSGVVRRNEKGDIVIDLNKTEGIIRRRDQVEAEVYKPGDRIQAYFLEIDTRAKGPMLILSRRHQNLVRALFALEVPEIAEGIVEIRTVAREPGVRTKIAVYSTDSDVDPVGACVGLKGSRVQSVVQEMRGEKIDIVLWDKDPARFVCNAIAPAQVSKVIIIEKRHSMEIIVPDDQLSLAIGRKGQNVRLAANLSGWNIDIYSESKVEEMAKFAKARLVEDLEVSEAIATLLYSHAFRSVEEIVETPEAEFLAIPGFDAETLKAIHGKAKTAIVRRKEAASRPPASTPEGEEARVTETPAEPASSETVEPAMGDKTAVTG